MDICIYICIFREAEYIFIYTYIHIYAHINIHIHVHVMCVYKYMRMHMHVVHPSRAVKGLLLHWPCYFIDPSLVC